MRIIIILLLSAMLFLISCNQEKKDQTAKGNHDEIAEESDVEMEETFYFDEKVSVEIDTTEEELYPETSRKIFGDWHEFVSFTWDSTGTSSSIYDTSYYGGSPELCKFKQLFENGIRYEFSGCGEGGETEHIIFPGFSKIDMYNIINIHLTIDENTWNEDSTEYQADGAGCYYSIIEKQDTTVISTYCGC